MKSTSRLSKKKRGIECLNCEQPLYHNDNFCSNCGQTNDLKSVSVKQFVSEFFANFFSFDSRFIRTVIPLLFKPGKVSKDYIEGKRMRYANPFRLYLNVTIIFFLLQGLFSTVDKYNPNEYSSENDIITIKDSTNSSSVTDSTYRDLIVPEQKKKSTNNLTSNVLLRIDSIFTSTNLLEQLKTESNPKNVKDSLYKNFFDSNNKYISEQIDNAVKNNNWNVFQTIADLDKNTKEHVEGILKKNGAKYTIPEEYSLQSKTGVNKLFSSSKLDKFIKYDKNNPNKNAFSAMHELGIAKTRLNAFYFKLAQNFNKLQNDPNFRESYGDNIISKISVALFFLLPIFSLFLLLLYVRHKWSYTEHLIFVFNTQTVFFLLLILFVLIARLFDTNTSWKLFILLFVIYLFKALRNFYGQSRIKTFIKFLLLNIFYYILSAIGLIIVSFITFIL